jgi:hypothetical protein
MDLTTKTSSLVRILHRKLLFVYIYHLLDPHFGANRASRMRQENAIPFLFRSFGTPAVLQGKDKTQKSQ